MVFASFGLLVLAALKLRLPNDTPRFAARGVVTSYPSAASVNQPEVEEGIEVDNALPREEVRLRWRDERFASWLVAGLIGGHAQAIMLGVVGFLIRDRLGLHDLPKETVEATGSVMFVGAMATLLAQWGLIPILQLSSRASVLWGSFLALLGIALVAVSFHFYGITLGFALASLGFGLFRPGFTTGASLAVRRFEQGDVAGKIASLNGSAYIFTPAIGVALFNWWEPATFILIGAALLCLILWGRKALADAPRPPAA